MQPQSQNNTLQTLKRQRTELLWKGVFPHFLLVLALGYVTLRFRCFVWWILLPFSPRLKDKFEEISKLNTKIKQHMAQSGFRIEDEYPPRMVGP